MELMLKMAKQFNWKAAIKINLLAYAAAAELVFSVYLFEWKHYKREIRFVFLGGSELVSQPL